MSDIKEGEGQEPVEEKKPEVAADAAPPADAPAAEPEKKDEEGEKAPA